MNINITGLILFMIHVENTTKRGEGAWRRGGAGGGDGGAGKSCIDN